MSGIEDYEAIAQRAKALKSGYAASFDYAAGAPKPRVFKSGINDNGAIREELRKRGYKPVWADAAFEFKPRCPRHDGQHCTRPCAEHSDCPRGVVA